MSGLNDAEPIKLVSTALAVDVAPIGAVKVSPDTKLNEFVALKPNKLVEPKLIFNASEFASVETGLIIVFKCPPCGFRWKHPLTFGSALKGDWNFNDLITLSVPEHECASKNNYSGATVSLFVAVHRDVDGLRLCIQKSSEEGAAGIPADWWVRPKP